MKHSCKFVRKTKDGLSYEYGHIEVTEHATPKEVRKHVVAGKADSYEDALRFNDMVQEGLARRSFHGLNLSPLWRD